MIDTQLAAKLLSAIRDNSKILLVGDQDQLPSVGPGSVFKNLLDNENIRNVKLTEIFRQASKSNIVFNAHRVNSGKYLYKETMKTANSMTSILLHAKSLKT